VIVTGGEDGIIRWWDVATGYQLIGTLPLHRGTIQDLGLSADGKFLAAGSRMDDRSGVLHLWELARPLSRPAGKGKEADLKAPWAVRTQTSWMSRQGVAYSPDTRCVATGGAVGYARLWHSVGSESSSIPLRHCWRLIPMLTFSPDGRLLATASQDTRALGDACLWDVSTGRSVGPPLPHLNWVSALAFSPDGKVLATGSYDWALRFWDTASGRQLGPSLSQGGIVLNLAFSPDGSRLAVGRARSAEGQAGVLLWEVSPTAPGDRPAIRLLRPLLPGPELIARFSPDGKRLLSSAWETFRLLDPVTGEAAGPLLSETSEVNTVAFSTDGRTVLTGSTDGTARLWDVTTGAPVGAPMLHGLRINVAAFSPDPESRLILTGCADGSARLWDRATQKLLGSPALQSRSIQGATFTPDGQSFLITTEDGKTRSWPVPEPLEGDPDRLALRLQVRTGLHMGAGQTVMKLSAEQWEHRRRELVALEGSAVSTHAGSVSDRDYHDARAQDAEQDSAVFAAGWHLDRLLAASAAPPPSPWLTHARRAHVYATAGRLDQAEVDYARALRLGTPEELRRWDRDRSIDCLTGRQWQAALWYLDRVVAAAPKEWTGYADRATAWGKLGKTKECAADTDRAAELGADGIFLLQLADEGAERGEWDRVATLCTRAGERGPCPFWAWPQGALAALKTGNPSEYRRVCSFALKGAEAAPLPALINSAAWVCALGPDALSDYRQPLSLAEGALSRSAPGDRPAVLNTLGALLYRAGRWQEAVARLREGVQAHQGQGSVQDWIFLAMSYHQLGETTLAHQFLARAKEGKSGQHAWEALERELLLREAESLVEKHTPKR
jgi:WD40 repeat protein/tetratricopeptide (TPR) repeat protein